MVSVLLAEPRPRFRWSAVSGRTIQPSTRMGTGDAPIVHDAAPGVGASVWLGEHAVSVGWFRGDLAWMATRRSSPSRFLRAAAVKRLRDCERVSVQTIGLDIGRPQQGLQGERRPEKKEERRKNCLRPCEARVGRPKRR